MIDLPPTPYVLVCNVGEITTYVALGTKEKPPVANIQSAVIAPQGIEEFPRGENTELDFIGSALKVRGLKSMQYPPYTCEDPKS
jgi:hypothetical protein